MTATVEEAVREILAGSLVVLPTDTVYGIGCVPFDEGAVERLFAAKERPRELELPILVPSRESAARIAALDDRARSLADRFWPGALTMVLPRTAEAAAWPLGGNPETIGVRMPRSETALELLRRTGPLAVTSANRSGSPTPSTCEGVRSVFGSRVAAYLCSDTESGGRASSVVDLTGTEPRILREGSLARRVLEVLERSRSPEREGGDAKLGNSP